MRIPLVHKQKNIMRREAREEEEGEGRGERGEGRGVERDRGGEREEQESKPKTVQMPFSRCTLNNILKPRTSILMRVPEMNKLIYQRKEGKRERREEKRRGERERERVHT